MANDKPTSKHRTDILYILEKQQVGVQNKPISYHTTLEGAHHRRADYFQGFVNRFIENGCNKHESILKAEEQMKTLIITQALLEK